MKVIHTYANQHEVLWKELLYTQYLSAILAKKHYGNISFYCTPKIRKQVEELNLPYDFIDDKTINQQDLKCWSVPKVKVFNTIEEQYLHLDTDTLLFDKFQLGEYKNSNVFSHLDLGPSNRTEFILNENNCYSKLFSKLKDEMPAGILNTFDFSSIPNTNLAYIGNPKLFKEASDFVLDFYGKHKKVIDQDIDGPCFIDQLMLHFKLRELNSEYLQISDKHNHVFFNNIPFSVDNRNNSVNNDAVSLEGLTFPLTYNVIHKDTQEMVKYTLEDKTRETLLSFLDYNFNGFLHLTYQKWFDIFQAMIIHKLRKEIGDNQLQKIHSYFRKIHPNLPQNLLSLENSSDPLPMKSKGEELYENLTGFKFIELD